MKTAVHLSKSGSALSASRGFTLVELMITVLIVTILAAIAVPQYNSYALRSHRASAQAALLQASQWLERAVTANGLYPEPNVFPDGLELVEGGRYTITYAPGAAPRTTYLLTATAEPVQAVDGCGNLTLTETGVRGRSGTAPLEECW